MAATLGTRSSIGMTLVVTAVLGTGLLAAWYAQRDARGAVRASLSLEETLGGADTVGYARAVEPPRFVFPDDHGPHPDFRNEWWYVTGNLETENGQRFGYQLTFFRSALSAASPDRESAWATRQAWMAHFALTDVSGGRFDAFERFARGAVGLAGGRAVPFRVWLEDWSIESVNATTLFPIRIRASRGESGIDLLLDAGKAPVLNGDSGLSRKGARPGNASYYYSFTRLPTTGTVASDGAAARVTGESWIDREWSTSALAEGVVGWDWFALQLDDGSELMLYVLRREDGTADRFSGATFTNADGVAQSLGPDDFTIQSTAVWRSPVDNAAYPARWSIRVPAQALELDVVPVMANQEHTGSFRYWEGAVDATGSHSGRSIAARGYAELTGYSQGTAGARAVRSR